MVVQCLTAAIGDQAAFVSIAVGCSRAIDIHGVHDAKVGVVELLSAPIFELEFYNEKVVEILMAPRMGFARDDDVVLRLPLRDMDFFACILHGRINAVIEVVNFVGSQIGRVSGLGRGALPPVGFYCAWTHTAIGDNGLDAPRGFF